MKISGCIFLENKGKKLQILRKKQKELFSENYMSTMDIFTKTCDC
jgi:hypothetical protein